VTTQCKLCGKDINPHDTASWKEVTGFVGGPKKDSMVLRTDTGQFACTPCIHKAREGQAPDQPSIFDEVEQSEAAVSKQDDEWFA
jgi:hypothetical protein